jgi:hypothetical protein
MRDAHVCAKKIAPPLIERAKIWEDAGTKHGDSLCKKTGGIALVV